MVVATPPLTICAASSSSTRSRAPYGGARPGQGRPPLRSRHPVHVVGVRSTAAQRGLLGSMGSVGDAVDSAVAESFFATVQTELFDRQDRWAARRELAGAIFEWIECFYNRVRHHSTFDYLAPSSTTTRRPASADAA